VIHFVKNISHGQIRIGFADRPNKRLADLQTGPSETLVLIKATEGDRSTEATLHKQSALHRLQGEWSAPDDEIVQFIKGRDDKSLDDRLTAATRGFGGMQRGC